MDNELVYSADATYQKAQYDASAKRLLGQKIILAHILIRLVEEFKGMDADMVDRKSTRLNSSHSH